MNLKESFQYMNFLENLLGKVNILLNRKEFVTTTTEHHMRSVMCANDVDEKITVPKRSDYTFEPTEIIEFSMKILEEKEKLSYAIHEAKKNTKINLDHAVSMNKKKQELARTYSNLYKIVSSENIKNAYGYTFNAEGNQVRYVYNVNEVNTIDYDRTKVKALAKKLNKECETTSNEIDKIMIETEVSYEYKWDMDDTIEDILEIEKIK